MTDNFHHMTKVLIPVTSTLLKKETRLAFIEGERFLQRADFPTKEY